MGKRKATFQGTEKVWLFHRWIYPGDVVQIDEDRLEEAAARHPFEVESDEKGDIPDSVEEALEADYNAQIRFLSAHDALPESRKKESILAALKAFEDEG
jgi:hypothetical protein